MLTHFSHVRFFVTLWTVALQAPLSMEFSRQESWSGLPCPPPGDLPDPGIKPMSLKSPALAGGFFTARALQSPDNMWCGASFICLFAICLCSLVRWLFHISGPLLELFSYYWVLDVFVYFGYTSFIKCVFYKYFLPVCGLSFHFLKIYSFLKWNFQSQQ